jgi:hypothetical protein
MILRISISPLDAKSAPRIEASRRFAFFLSNAKRSQLGHLFFLRVPTLYRQLLLAGFGSRLEQHR